MANENDINMAFNLMLKRNIALSQEILGLRNEMYELVKKQVDKIFADRIDMIEGSLRESIIHKEILIDKGFITRQEVNDKYDELKAKADGTTVR